MIRILLVDDEKIIRRGLALMIEKLGGEFQVIGEASDGEQALVLAEQEIPDIVISDIRMPRMDGLRLSQILDERYPDIRKIILSGFDDFDYARQAIRHRAVDYLLKPVDELALLELLKKTAEDIQTEAEHRSAAMKLKTSHAQNLPLLRDIFLREMIIDGKCRDMDNREIIKHSQDCDMRLGFGQISQVILIRAENQADPAAQAAELRRLTENWLSCANSSEQGHPDPAYILQENMLLILAVGWPSDAAADGGRALFALLEQNHQGRFCVCAGSAVQRPTDLHDSYVAALRVMNGRFYDTGPASWHGGDQDIHCSGNLPSGISENFNNQLASIHEVLNQPMLMPVVRDFLSGCRDLWLEPSEVCRILEDAFNNLRINNPRFRKAVEDEYGAAWQFGRELTRNATLGETGNFLTGFLNTVLVRMKKNTGHKEKKIIEVVKDFIQSHLQQEITLASLSQIAFISPNYLSEVFKEQTGESIVDYITRLRILKAKDLLKDIRIKVYEVGKLVGYEDPAYFSKVFRKVVGVSPAEYRNLVI